MRFGSAPKAGSLSSSAPKLTWQPSRRSEAAARKEQEQQRKQTYVPPPAPWSPKITSSFSSSPKHTTTATATLPVNIPSAGAGGGGIGDHGSSSFAAKAKREAQRDLRLWLAGQKGGSAAVSAAGLEAFFQAHPRHKRAMMQCAGSVESFVRSVPGVDSSFAGSEEEGGGGGGGLIKLAVTPSSPALPVWYGRGEKGSSSSSSSVRFDAGDDADADDEGNDSHDHSSGGSSGGSGGGGFHRAHTHRRHVSNSSAASNSSGGDQDSKEDAKEGAKEAELFYMHTPARSDLPCRPAASMPVPVPVPVPASTANTSNTTTSSFIEEDGYGVVGVLLEYGVCSETDDDHHHRSHSSHSSHDDGISSSGLSDFEFEDYRFDDDDNKKTNAVRYVATKGRRLFAAHDDGGDETDEEGWEDAVADADTTLIALDPAYLAETAAEIAAAEIAAAAAENGEDDGADDDVHELALDMLSSSWSRLRKAGALLRAADGRDRSGSMAKQPKPHLGTVVM